MKNKGLIGLHAKTTSQLAENSPERQATAVNGNTVYGQVDTKGWAGLTRINSIQDNFGGGCDPSNKAMRRSLIKPQQSRPISANPHISRTSMQKAPLDQASKLDSLNKLGRSQKRRMIDKTISTAAVTNPTYNAASMSKRFTIIRVTSPTQDAI